MSRHADNGRRSFLLRRAVRRRGRKEARRSGTEYAGSKWSREGDSWVSVILYMCGHTWAVRISKEGDEG